MTRTLRTSALILPALAAAWASYACGQRLRHAAASPADSRVRVTSLYNSGIGSGEVYAADRDDNPAETFQDILRYVKSDYVNKIEDESKLGFGAVKNMLVSLDDPKTRFYDPAQRKHLIEQLNGQFNGIGAVVQVVKQKKSEIDLRRLAVVAPVPGGPADKAGIRAGDVITEIDGKWVIAYDPRLDFDHLSATSADDKEVRKAFKEAAKKLTDGLSLPKALEQLSTNSDRPITLSIERGGAAPLKVTVAPASTQLDPVEYKELSGGTGYLRITQFGDKATQAFSTALASAKEKSLIIDLRGNAGGPITGREGGAYGSALALLSKLTPGGQVGTLVRQGGKPEPITVKGGAASPYKIAVLVNAGTANLAELVAAGLKERAGAQIVGTATFGDSVYQKLVELQQGAAMTLTAGKMMTARGVDFTGKGLQPDVAAPAAGPQSADAAVEKALGALKAVS